MRLFVFLSILSTLLSPSEAKADYQRNFTRSKNSCIVRFHNNDVRLRQVSSPIQLDRHCHCRASESGRFGWGPETDAFLRRLKQVCPSMQILTVNQIHRNFSGARFD